MAKRIWKFPIGITDVQKVRAPLGAQFFEAQMQNERLCLWAIVDEDNAPIDYVIFVLGTGNPIPDTLDTFSLAHIGTVFDRQFVWHVFVRDRNAM